MASDHEKGVVKVDSRNNRKPTPRQAPTRRPPVQRPTTSRKPLGAISESLSNKGGTPGVTAGTGVPGAPAGTDAPGVPAGTGISVGQIQALARQHTPAVLLAALVVLLILIAISASFCANRAATNDAADDSQGGLAGGAATQTQPATQTQLATQLQPATVHFVAVGDNLPEDQIGAYADAQAGEVGDGVYDYTSLYEHVKPYIESADLAYVKEETHIGGDEIGPLGYPSYNTTDEMADALVATGFDFVASASNHAYDWGAYGANEHSCELWKTKSVAFTGTADSEEDAQMIATVERNGITFVLLDYTYGLNGYEQSDVPSYAVNFIDKDRIASDVARAREQADVVLVAMHWGTENYMDIDDEQAEYAQYLADLGVDVVLGSHPHVIGPMQWVDGKGGNKTLVAYSLGNFITRHDYPLASNDLEGMLSCDFVRDESGKVSVENVVWTPLVNHTDGETFRVYALKDYSNDLAAQNPTLSSFDDPIAYLKQLTRETVGENFTFDD